MAGPALAGPTVISGSETCPNCADRNTDWNRYRNEAYNCALGSYNSQHCTNAKNTLINGQYVASSNKGVRVKICSGISGGNYGCQNVDVYWDFSNPPISTNALFEVVADIINDFEWHDVTPPFTVLRGVSIKLVSPDGNRHDVYYDDSEILDGTLTQRDRPTYPPYLGYPPGHPYAPAGCAQAAPVVDALHLDGTLEHRGLASQVSLGRTRAEDGRELTQDQVEREPDALVVYHAGEHLRNARYAPTPRLHFAPRAIHDPGTSRAGWAAITIGESGVVRGVAVHPAGGGSTAAIEAALHGAITTVFPDERRHDHTVYVAWRVDERDMLRQQGEGLISVPMCCPPQPCLPPNHCDLP
jgi:hypothetical protein